jgi:hypothetical protein
VFAPSANRNRSTDFFNPTINSLVHNNTLCAVSANHVIIVVSWRIGHWIGCTALQMSFSVVVVQQVVMMLSARCSSGSGSSSTTTAAADVSAGSQLTGPIQGTQDP